MNARVVCSNANRRETMADERMGRLLSKRRAEAGRVQKAHGVGPQLLHVFQGHGKQRYRPRV